MIALLIACMFGTASVFSRRGLEYASFRSLLGVSLAVGSTIFVIVAVLTTGFANTPPRGALYIAVGAVMGSVIGRSFYFLGINYLGPGKSLSINATSPLFAAILAWTVLNERISSLVILGTVTVILGIVILSKDVRSQAESEDHSIGVVVFPFFAAVFAAIAVTFRKLALDAGIAPIEAGTINMVVGLFVVSPLFATRWREEIVDIDPRALRNYVIASTIMALAFLIYFEGLRVTNASVFFPLVQTQPLFAVGLSAVFLSRLEIITRWSILGSVIIVGGAALIVVG